MLHCVVQAGGEGGVALLALYAAAIAALWLVFMNPLVVAHYGSTAPLVAGFNLYFFSLLFMVGYLAGVVSDDLSMDRFTFLTSLLRNGGVGGDSSLGRPLFPSQSRRSWHQPLN